jgi:hypothetical protein
MVGGSGGAGGKLPVSACGTKLTFAPHLRQNFIPSTGAAQFGQYIFDPPQAISLDARDYTPDPANWFNQQSSCARVSLKPFKFPSAVTAKASGWKI